jgi:small subunit ribosomal protein S8
LVKEGYLVGYTKEVSSGVGYLFRIVLKYVDGSGAIKSIWRVSKPGRRIYSSVKDLPSVRNGLGISILSTSKGVVSDYTARGLSVGGEIICSVF